MIIYKQNDVSNASIRLDKTKQIRKYILLMLNIDDLLQYIMQILTIFFPRILLRAIQLSIWSRKIDIKYRKTEQIKDVNDVLIVNKSIYIGRNN